MRGRFPAVGAIAIVAVAGALVPAGCGSSSGPIVPAPGALRETVKRTVDPELEKEGVTARQIACVNRNIDATPERKIAGQIVTGAPAEQVEGKSATARLGSYGKGCF